VIDQSMPQCSWRMTTKSIQAADLTVRRIYGMRHMRE
jgi:hypothetical protein